MNQNTVITRYLPIIGRLGLAMGTGLLMLALL